MLEYIKQLILIIYYTICNLLRGNEEWKCTTNAEEASRKICCSTKVNAEDKVYHSRYTKPPTTTANDRVHTFPNQSSLWQRTKDKIWQWWGTLKSVFRRPSQRINLPTERQEDSQWRAYLTVIPRYLVQGIVWIAEKIWAIILFVLSLLIAIVWTLLGKRQEPTVADEKKTPASPLKTVPQSDDHTSPTPYHSGEIQTTPSVTGSTIEEPISFYVRKVSLSTDGLQPPPRPSPPPPPPPPAPRPAKLTIGSEVPPVPLPRNHASTPEIPPQSPVRGGVAVIVPGLVTAAKESVERRQRARTQSPAPDSLRVRPISTMITTTVQDTNGTTNNRIQIKEQRQSGGNHYGPTDSEGQFVFRPHNRNVYRWSEEPETRYRNTRLHSVPPQTSDSNYFLGRSVFTPVQEVEKLRTNFNQRVREFSRSPSVGVQRYYDNDRQPVNSTPTPYSGGRISHSDGLRHREKWTLREKDDDVVFSRLPIGATRRVLEKKVTEKHLEKDVSGAVLNGWREQNWVGTYETFDNTAPLL